MNAEFMFRCADCGTCCETWHLAEMLNFSDGHQAVCDGRVDGEPL